MLKVIPGWIVLQSMFNKFLRRNFLMAMLFICGSVLFSNQLAAKSKKSIQLKVGDNAPSFALRNLEGGYVKLSSFCGKYSEKSRNNRSVVILDFFATWCEPCIEQMPVIESIHQKYKEKGVKVFLVSNDIEGAKKVLPFVKKSKIAVPVLLDMYRVVADKYGVDKIPYTFVISKDGKIAAMYQGKKDNLVFRKELEGKIEELLPNRKKQK